MPIDRKSLDVFFQNVTNSDSHEKEEKHFNKRISTYVEGQKWMRKPLSISPAVCSQYGWICINSNLLECETCGAKLCCPELKIEFYDAYKACIEKLLQDLKSNHKAYCPWPLTPAPDCFLLMPTLPKEESFKHFTRRLKSSFQCLSDFPQIQDEIFSLLGLEKHHIKELCKLSEIDSEKIEQYGMSAVALASTGWMLKKNKEEQIFITCDSCQRSIWSKVFTLIIPNKNEVTSASQDDKETSLTEEPSVTPSKRIKKEDFNPLEEHRPWCLWIITKKENCNSQCEDNSCEETEDINNTPGWKIFINSLLKNIWESQESNIKSRPSKEQIRSARDLLDTWTNIAE